VSVLAITIAKGLLILLLLFFFIIISNLVTLTPVSATSEVMPPLGTAFENAFGRSVLTHTSGSLMDDFRLR
jgi:F0F1-type ATP synthase membrane subunit a